MTNQDLILELNKFLIKNNNFLTNVKFKVKESEEDIGSIEILYIINKDDDAEIRKEIYDIISNIVYNDFENKGFTENEIDNILISYDYFNEIGNEIFNNKKINRWSIKLHFTQDLRIKTIDFIQEGT